MTWHHNISRKSHLLVLRYRHFYTAKNYGKEKILTDIIKFISNYKNNRREKTLTDIIKCISIFKNCNPVMFGIILKLEVQGSG